MSCNILGSNTESSDCGSGIIIPGECIEGVKLGDSRDQVEKLLVETGNFGWAHGLYRVWHTYLYRPSVSQFSGLSLGISFIYYGVDQPGGTVDMIIVSEPNDGKTF